MGAGVIYAYLLEYDYLKLKNSRFKVLLWISSPYRRKIRPQFDAESFVMGSKIVDGVFPCQFVVMCYECSFLVM